MWCIGILNAEYRKRMYDILELYALPYNSEEPVVCVDEKSKQLIEETRESISGKKGKTKKIDYEYKRNGTRNIFVAVEPKKGKRHVKVTKRRTKSDFAYFIKDIVMRKYKSARKVHIVLDNLNTHFESSFYETFAKEEADEILARIKFHYTPKHASWLNMAEIEIGAMDKQCLNQRIPTEKKMKSELKAWQKRRNKKKATIDWKFTKQDADEKLGDHYT